MSKEILLTPKAPYLHVIGTDASTITNFGRSLANDNSKRVVVRFLRGKKMRNLFGLFNESSAALQFPYYFGENWNAFDECITDLEWIPGDAYILILTNSNEILVDEIKDELKYFVEILEDAGSEWGKPVKSSNHWDRPAKPFHIIFQVDPYNKDSLLTYLNSIEASFQEIKPDGIP